LLWFVMSTFFYYWLGTSLERQWGTTRFNVFYFLGVVLNLILGFVLNVGVSMYYVNMSLFFSFATLYPDMQVLLYGI
ncbi:rhomboid family intramembrane serine protease, partial [Vibrio cholerae]